MRGPPAAQAYVVRCAPPIERGQCPASLVTKYGAADNDNCSSPIPDTFSMRLANERAKAFEHLIDGS